MRHLFEQLHEAENAMLWWLCFFYFLFNKRSPEDVFGKDSFSAYIISWKQGKIQINDFHVKTSLPKMIYTLLAQKPILN